MFYSFQVCREEKEAGKLFVPTSNVVERAAYLTGVSARTLYRIQKQHVTPAASKDSNLVSKQAVVVDDFDKDVVRRTVSDLVRTKGIIATIEDIREELSQSIGFKGSRETFRKLLKSLGFRWKATQTNRSLLMERTDIVAARIQYLRQIRKYREEGRPIVYTDETFVHTSHSAKRSWQSDDYAIKVPFSKGSRYIIVHAGSKAGFVQGAEMFCKAKTTTGDYHHEMNSGNTRPEYLLGYVL